MFVHTPHWWTTPKTVQGIAIRFDILRYTRSDVCSFLRPNFACKSDYWPILRNNSEMVRDSYHGINAYIRAIDWYINRWPWMTSNSVMAVFVISPKAACEFSLSADGWASCSAFIVCCFFWLCGQQTSRWRLDIIRCCCWPNISRLIWVFAAIVSDYSLVLRWYAVCCSVFF